MKVRQVAQQHEGKIVPDSTGQSQEKNVDAMCKTVVKCGRPLLPFTSKTASNVDNGTSDFVTKQYLEPRPKSSPGPQICKMLWAG